MKNITLRYFSSFGASPGIQHTPYATQTATVRELLHEVQAAHAIPLTTNISKAAINDAFVEWDSPFNDGDTITFLPPFSGG